jgi:hypothetical protein
MPRKQHVVTLSSADRQQVRHLIGAGVAPARQLTRARILLKADTGAAGRRWTDARIAEAVECSPRTVARVRADFGARGLAQTLHRQPPTRVYARKLDGEGEARLLAEACGPPPPGHAIWTLQLLADRLVELAVVEAIAPNTVRATLQKTRSNRG